MEADKPQPDPVFEYNVACAGQMIIKFTSKHDIRHTPTKVHFPIHLRTLANQSPDGTVYVVTQESHLGFYKHKIRISEIDGSRYSHMKKYSYPALNGMPQKFKIRDDHASSTDPYLFIRKISSISF
jgi:hypothetical protein